MKYIRPVWLTHSGEKKDFEVYSCHVSPDGTRLVTAAGGERNLAIFIISADSYVEMDSSVSGLQMPSTMRPTLPTASPDSCAR